MVSRSGTKGRRRRRPVTSRRHHGQRAAAARSFRPNSCQYLTCANAHGSSTWRRSCIKPRWTWGMPPTLVSGKGDGMQVKNDKSGPSLSPRSSSSSAMLTNMELNGICRQWQQLI